jgi:maltose alpha-D-glucosyltransferase/alpha-amylase
MSGADWLADAVLYEIYPQSFADSDGDGIGDLPGVIAHLDYVASLGVDAIWFNPCFASPFVDAGYDVSDYLRIAPRYGTNDDLVRLVDAARARGIRVILDLVAGHTSVEHAWFQHELNASGPDPLGDRYVWCEEPPAAGWGSDLAGTPAWVRSPGPRPGYYLKNFFDAQPALNFGWTELDPAEPWRDGTDAPGPRRNIESLKEILAFWLDRGVAGFRVDMAFSLVKGYDGEAAQRRSAAIWREIRDWLDVSYPGTVLIPEGREPRTGQRLAFDADFLLVIYGEHASLFDNGGAGLLPFHPQRPAYFDADGVGSTDLFVGAWEAIQADDPGRLVLLSSADHDFDRLCCGPRTAEQLGAALTFLLTWGTVPCLYYGDEIGMRYVPGSPDVEGAVCNPTYNRAGCRTPMQWDRSENAGFSTAEADRLYLPIDPDPERPTVADQEADPASTLALVRRLTALRRQVPALRTRSTTEVLHASYPFVYRRGGTHVVAVNPRREPATAQVISIDTAEVLVAQGLRLSADTLALDGFGYAVLAVRTTAAD